MSKPSLRLLLSGASSIAIAAALSHTPAVAAQVFGPGVEPPIVISADTNFVFVTNATVTADGAGSAFVIQAGVTVSATASAVFFNQSNFLGSVANNGSIVSGAGLGWNFATVVVDGDLENNGFIIGGNAGAGTGAGLRVANSLVTGDITNTGTAQGGSGGAAHGADIFDSTVSGDIVNAGHMLGGASVFGANGLAVNNVTMFGAIRNESGGVMIGGSASDVLGQANGLSITNNSFVGGGVFTSGFISGGTSGGSRHAILVDNSTISGGIHHNDFGTIVGGTDGSAIAILNGSVVTDGIENNALAIGVALGNGLTIDKSTVSGAIVNTGSLSGRRGINIEIATVTDGIVNDGTVRGRNTAINIDLSSFAGGITNNTTGSIVGGGEAGIKISDSVFTDGIANDGWLTGGENGAGIFMFGSTFSGGIHNSANGSILGDNFDAITIFSTVNYSGGLLNEGHIDAVNADAIDIATSSFTGTLDNAGLVSSNTTAIRVTGFIADGIFNSGTVMAPTAINIAGAAVGQTITQTDGQILGNIMFSQNGESFFVGKGGYFQGQMLGTLNDNDHLTVVSSIWSGEGGASGMGDIAVTGGIGVFGGRFYGDLIGSGFDVTTSTNFGATSGHAFIDDNSQISVVDNLSFTEESTLEFLLTNNTGAFGTLVADDFAFLDGRIAAYLDWNSFASLGAGNTQDFSYTGVIAAIDLVGAFDNEGDVDTNSVFFTATATQRLDQFVDIDVHRIGFDEILPAPTSNQQPVGDALEEIFEDPDNTAFLALEDPNGDGLQNPQETNEGLYSALFQLATLGDVAAAYSSLDGHNHAAIFQTAFTIADLMDRNIQARINDVHDRQDGTYASSEPTRYAAATIIAVDGVSGSAKGGSGWSAWARAFGSWGDADGDALNEGFDQDSRGFGMGIDYQSGRSLIGLAGQFAATEVEFDPPFWAPFGAEADIDSWQLALYGYHSFGTLFIDGNASATFNNYDARRTDFWGQPIVSNYDSTVYSIYGEIGADLSSGRFNFQPFGGVGFRHASFDNFVERCPLFCLAVEPDDAESLYSALGVRASATYRWGRTPIIPEVRVAWQHEFSDDRGAFDAAFVGAPDSPFHVEGHRFSDDRIVVGAGLSAEVTRNFVLFADYNATLSGDFDAHGVAAGMRVTW